ncbi:metallophosphoesterase family protein [Allosphingosinicella deserti]|nr:metallophosphoesterase [Sphingomonas deserti]
MRIAVISDIHAAAGPFREALAAARRTGFDQLLLLGDLLTYGVHPDETLDLACDAVTRDGAVLVRGNHDQIYLDRATRRSGYEATIPEWIRESVEWTWARIGGGDRIARFDWLDDWSVDGLLMAHANPYQPGDWSYLRAPEDLIAACSRLADRGLRAGLFGHTHRFATQESHGSSVTTLGSVGQPRDAGHTSEWSLVDWTKGKMALQRHRVAVEWGTIIRAVRATGLSDKTKDRICGYIS